MENLTIQELALIFGGNGENEIDPNLSNSVNKKTQVLGYDDLEE